MTPKKLNGLLIIEEDGSEVYMTCSTNYFNEEECHKHHRGMMGCDPNCPHKPKEGE